MAGRCLSRVFCKSRISEQAIRKLFQSNFPFLLKLFSTKPSAGTICLNQTFGSASYARRIRGRVKYHLDDYTGSLADLDKADALDPNDASILQ